MAIKEDIRSVTYLKSKTADLLKQLNDTHRPVVITQNGEPRAVLQDPETYDRLRQTLALLQILAMSEQSREKHPHRDHDEVVDSLRARLRKQFADS